MPLPSDGSYICTQEVPPPLIQFTVEVVGGVLTKTLTGEEFTWNEKYGWWQHEDGRHTMRFYEPMPPEVPEPRWVEVDTSVSPPQAFAGTWA